MCCGSLEYYDKMYDRVNVKNEKPLQRIDRIFHTVTTTDDPIIRKVIKIFYVEFELIYLKLGTKFLLVYLFK